MKVISGGQTGVDRAALDVALRLGWPCGGFCPRGRRAEDGPIPATYPLVELGSPSYAHRTRANVEAADATLILSPLPLRGGTLLTLRWCRALRKAHLVVDPWEEQAEEAVVAWLQQTHPAVLNVAGPRESQCPGIYRQSCRLLEACFRRVRLGLGPQAG
ncbi:MAG: putative molybdenum carrier protein [Thermoanaerobaculum sp.]|nr:putative molybdenum carrier protein [Thermoanaerobaculum sp.]